MMDTDEIQEAQSANMNGESDNETKMLCLQFKNGKLGAAFFDFEEKLFYMYDEISDCGPNYLVTIKLYNEVAPKYLLLFSTSSEEFTKSVLETKSTRENDTTYSSNSGKLPPNVFYAAAKDFSYEVCKTIVSKIVVSALEPVGEAKHEQELHIHSLINMNHRLSVQTLGALYRYLEKNWQFLKGEEDEDFFCLNISQVTMKNHVLLDSSTFKALQVFSKRAHDAGFKRGETSSAREGLSIFKLFLSDCKSKMGQISLRNILMNPINDKDELEKRLDFISFALQAENFGKNKYSISKEERWKTCCVWIDKNQNEFYTSHKDYAKAIQNSINRLIDINSLLTKIKNARATNRNWNSLHNTIKHIISINEISKPYVAKTKLLGELAEATTENLLGLQEAIDKTLDFQAGNKRDRPCIKFGLDEMLDAKLLRRSDISKHVTAAASFAIMDLPSYINECKVVYLPEMGHVMEIKEWEPNCDPQKLSYLGFQFMFNLGGAIYYKNPLCVELDKQLGDINSEIIDHENRIVRRLSAFVLKYSQDIRNPLKIIAMIDSLIGMAKTARRNGFVRPSLNNENVHEIKKCRHPLIEQLLNNFQANDFYSGQSYSHMKIITGPNGSGKSVYLKQVALNIFLAHVGSFVPAQKANIGLTKSIHCRMHATESASVNLSSFMIDIAQTSQALHYATSNSFVLIDEFGRGTLDDDGLVLLVSVLKTFLHRNEFCPHILVSTHFQRVANYIKESNLVEYFKTNYMKKEGNDMCFLYTLSKGTSSSFAFDIAARILKPELVERARQFLMLLKNDESVDESQQESMKVD